MAEGFGENVAPTAAIRAILGSYPFSIGLLREILQNTDDARATKQVFVLDRRSHGESAIYHPYLATTQGPALLAFNNELIRDNDWKALQNIHRSSKITDTSKIGKYGVGFRSCYHITDTPHILSGSHLAILDPKHDFAEFSGVKIGGVKLNIEEEWQKYSDHLAAFSSFFPQSGWGEPFSGSAFRLPLRTSASEISHKIVSPDEISDLLKDFAKEELNISLLFLRNVSSIEMYEISADGERTQIATATVDRTPSQAHGQYEIQKVTIRTHLARSSEEREWRIIHAPFSEAKAIHSLSLRLGGNPTTTLSQHKLSPVVDLAIPLNSSNSVDVGRLFTYLPLPLRTEFPVHINALFALTQSRQNLRNAGEVGVVKKSDDHALIEWNRLLFDTYIPQAWAALLEVLVKHDQVENIFNAWPSPQAEVYSGDYVYWKDLPLHVTKHALNLQVWPVFGTKPPSYHTAASLLIAEGSVEKNVLSALVHAGLLVTQPPEYLTQIILVNFTKKIETLSPEIAHRKLQYFIDEIRALDEEEAQIVLGYLLSTSNCHCIVGLPLIPSVAGDRMAVPARTASSRPHALLNEAEEGLFAAYDTQAVSLQRLASDIRRLIISEGPRVLNLTKLDPERVIMYLKASVYISTSQEAVTDDQIRWLNQFWDWAQKWFLKFTNQFHLVPTTRGLRRPTETVFDPQNEKAVTGVLELLGVSVIDPRFNAKTLEPLKQLQRSSNIHSLLRFLPSVISVEFSESQAAYLCAYLLKYLPSSCARHGDVSKNNLLLSRLRALPIFPIFSPTPDGVSSARRASIPSAVAVRGANPLKLPVLPHLDSITYLDLRAINQDMLKYLDPMHRFPLTVEEMQDLMLQNLKIQSLEMQVAFVKYLSCNSASISRGNLDRLKTTSFVTARDGTLRAPKDLVDPQASIATLFPGQSPFLPDTTLPIREALASHLRTLRLFITELSLNIVHDRVHFIAGGHCAQPEELAILLINLINDTRFDCSNLFGPALLSLEFEWIPTSEGLRSPLKCRDSLSHSGKRELFDEVMPMVNPDVQIGLSLRKAFCWDDEVTFEVLSQQLIKILDGFQPSYEKVHEVVKELGHRDLAESQLSSLREALKSRKWVPTRHGTLESVTFALLGDEDIPQVGFHSVVFDAHRHFGIHAFLREMGCVERPSKETILDHLRTLYASRFTETMNRRVTQGLIQLLTWLPQLAPEERNLLFIPDVNGALRPFAYLCYNDVGPRASLIDLGVNSLVHPDISPGLANDLGLRRLGLMSLQSQFDEDLDMGEDLMTTIRNRLREYTDSQLLLEFLANASDARAAEFNILLDQQRAPTLTLLSPRCAEFQRVPALVMHNNSVFTDNDFKGILRTGIGGKSVRKDTIGQFGLGALTMFHITEFAMIVSRDQVLFLNPCKYHLAVDRAALRLPLSTVRRLYGDHLFPLIGLFGFDPPEDVDEGYTYNGTIFRLPLRSSKQFQSVEPIFRKVANLCNLVSEFEGVATSCLLFTSLTSIRLFERKYHEPRLLWSVAAHRKDFSWIEGDISGQTVTITSPDSLRGCQAWRVLSLSVNEQQLPPFISSLQEQYRLRLPPVLRIAACPSPDPIHNLFSTLPLPIPLALPVHISGSFILASDRRSVRLDEYENLEASYNRWLLTTILPRLYLSLLADRALVSDNAVYWPGNAKLVKDDTYDVISTLVIDAVYREATTSHYPILKSKFNPHVLSPPAARFMTRLPRAVSKVLEAIKPLDAVKLPSSVTRRLRNAGESLVTLVTPKYVHGLILDNLTRFSVSILDLGEIQGLIDFLSKDSDAVSCLIGLPLLPLENGSFVKFDVFSNSCFYVAPEAADVFAPHRLVHHGLAAEWLLGLDDRLNVSKITSTNIGMLLDDHIPASQTLEYVDPITQGWIAKFWRIFPSLNISTKAISAYPLVPTLQNGHYLSLDYCNTPSIILADFVDRDWLPQCLVRMGFTLVNIGALSKELRNALRSSQLTVESVLSKILNHPAGVSTLFDRLDSATRVRLISWIRADFANRKRNYFQRHWQYRSLPIWRSGNGSFVSANDLQMLPRNVSSDSIASFTSMTVVGYDLLLVNMGIQPPSNLRSLLSIPMRLGEGLDDAYYRLVRVLLSFTSNGDGIPVPNSQRLIQESTTLYSSRDTLFVASFGDNSDRFLLPSFRRLESQLERFGLKRQHSLSMDMFRTCVEAFQGSPETDDRRERAAAIFQIFCEELPLRAAGSNQEAQWRYLGTLNFVPRNTSPRPLGTTDDTRYIAPHIRSLPNIVSPNHLVREEFQAIAWSQRAFYDTQPHQRVLMTYSNLSVPAVEEVVDHLVVLVTKVAREQANVTSCRVPLLDHLQQTYEWLNNHSEESKRYLSQCSGMALFLNDDVPPDNATDWNWKRADHILLDDYDTGNLQCPRDFIKSFRRLLIAAGAVIIKYGHEVGVEVPEQQPASDDRLSNGLRATFDEMRKTEICTDVSFVCDFPNNDPLRAHRAYLAAYSSYFRVMFSEGFREAGKASDKEPIVIEVPGFSRRCVGCILDYAYTGKAPKLEREDSDIELALEMLTLAHRWSMVDAQRAVENIIIKLKMVDPFNLDDVCATARLTESRVLLSYCNTYEINNMELVLQAREGSVAHN